MKDTKAWSEEQGTWNVIVSFGIRNPANNGSPKSSTNIQIPLRRFSIQDCLAFIKSYMGLIFVVRGTEENV